MLKFRLLPKRVPLLLVLLLGFFITRPDSALAQYPTLAYAGNDVTICSGETTTLGANSAGTGSGVWIVINSPGAGVFSDTNDNNSTYTPAAAGQHVLQWKITGAGQPTLTDEVIITVLTTPTAAFTTANVCEGAPVNFSDQSTGNGATISSWQWDVTGNGVNNYVSQNPTHNYSSSGTYNVRLIVNAQGCADTLNKNVFVNPKPVMSISADDECDQDAVKFENSNTISTGSIALMVWNYGGSEGIDTGYSVGFEPDHVFAQAGTYTVTNVAVSDSGCVSSETLTVEVHHLPVASFVVQNACQYQTANFQNQSSVTGDNIANWHWTFGDGTDTTGVANPSHDYDINGFIPVTLGVWSGFGCFDDEVVSVEIFPTPTADFNYTNDVCFGETTLLTDASTITYGSVQQFDWTVEGGNTYSGASASHTFPSHGVFDVRLDVISNNGCASFVKKEVPVYALPSADFKFDPECAGSPITFRDSSFFIGGGIASRVWTFGDTHLLSTAKNPQHTYDTHGVYTVKLVIESDQGCTDSTERNVEVFETIVPDIRVSVDSGCSPLAVLFDDSSTISKTDREMSFVWHYGDGFYRPDTAEYVYVNTSGRQRTYDIMLEVTTDQGCYSTQVIEQAIQVVPQPFAKFFSNPEIDSNSISVLTPFIQFFNNSEEANTLFWDFGDGKNSTEVNPGHEYEFEGEYEISLACENIYGCVDTVKKTVFITHPDIPFVPNTFTPNGDLVNDIFEIHGINSTSEIKLEVFDRFGDIIHTSEGLTPTWDGRNIQNKIVNQGVYGYRLTYDDSKGKEIEYQGFVSVLGVE